MSWGKNLLLRKYWFRTTRGFGVGVTAYTEAEAESLARSVIENSDLGDVLEITADVDVRDLDQEHVIPNMHPPNLHGIWFPSRGAQ